MDAPSIRSLCDPFTLTLGLAGWMDGSTLSRFKSWVRMDLEREGSTH